MILRCEVGVKLRCEKVRKGGVGTVSLQGRGKREGETKITPRSSRDPPKRPQEQPERPQNESKTAKHCYK